jgi:hypothetical protein
MRKVFIEGLYPFEGEVIEGSENKEKESAADPPLADDMQSMKL